MNKRICKKVYKRADTKLNNYIRLNGDKRSTLEVATEEHILSALERKVFFREQHQSLKLFNEIREELIADGKW